MMNNSKELVIITGLSGAGKSTAMGFMEDIGYYCIDNMPPVLLGTFLELISKREEYSRVAIVIDILISKPMLHLSAISSPAESILMQTGLTAILRRLLLLNERLWRLCAPKPILL